MGCFSPQTDTQWQSRCVSQIYFSFKRLKVSLSFGNIHLFLSYANRKLTRQLDMKKFGIKGTTNLFINENLTLLRKRLFWKTKQKVKEAGYKYIWTSNGNIFVRKVDEANPVAVNSEKDLNLIQ